MAVTRIWEAPRVTKPYTEAEWRDIEQLGHDVDADLAARDVRLTMGGEPTFVSIDDPDGEEWNTAALGTAKRKLAADLYHRLRKRYGAAGPGRISAKASGIRASNCRAGRSTASGARDGEPIWRDESLIADESRTAAIATEATAAEFLARRRRTAGPRRPSTCSRPTRTLFYYLWRERRLPANVDPFDSRLEDALERERLGAGILSRSQAGRRLCPPGDAGCGERTLAQRILVSA